MVTHYIMLPYFYTITNQQITSFSLYRLRFKRWRYKDYSPQPWLQLWPRWGSFLDALCCCDTLLLSSHVNSAVNIQSLGRASTVYAYPKYYTELNDEAGESEDTVNEYPDQKQGTIKTMLQEILLKATSSSTNGTNYATEDRVFSNLFSLFFVLAGIWGDLLIIRICLTCAYIFMLPFQILVNGYKENYAWIAACIYLHGSTVVRLIINEGKVTLDEKQEQVSSLLHLHCSVFDCLLSLYSFTPRC